MQNSLIVPPPAPVVLRPGDVFPDPQGLAYFLDFDGTLVDLAPRPEDITLPPDLVQTLLALSETAKGALAIITGRERGFILDRLGTSRLEVVGLHGAEIAGVAVPPPPERALALARAYASRSPGIVAEDKGGAFALHYRLAPERAAEVAAVMAEVAALAGGAYRLRAGKAVQELCPSTADKGAALLQLMTRAPFKGRRPLAIGDDLTDEAMFLAANRLDGHSVFVGPEPEKTARGETAARHRLGSPAAVRRFLQELAQ